MTETRDLARIRAEVARKRHPVVTRSVPLAVVAMRPARQPTRWQRFTVWRKDPANYVADQALRVVAILSGAAVVATACLAGFVALAGCLIGALAGVSFGAVLLVLGIAWAFAAGSRSATPAPGHRDGWGLHWSRCKR